MNNIELIADALREIGVLDAAATAPNSEDGALGLRKLNALMSGLEDDGIDLGYFRQTDVNDELPLEDSDADTVLPLLAMTLSINFPAAQIPPTLPALAADNMRRLLRNAVLQNAQEASMTNLPRGEGQGCNSNIITGE